MLKRKHDKDRQAKKGRQKQTNQEKEGGQKNKEITFFQTKKEMNLE